MWDKTLCFLIYGVYKRDVALSPHYLHLRRFIFQYFEI
jgi:hypothetical protein